MTIQLRGGFETEDLRLDRLPQFDERSRSYAIRELLPKRKLRSYTWRLPPEQMLDQGREGACVGFAITQAMMSRRLKIGAKDYGFAHRLYKRAQDLDPWPGSDYSGTSVLAGLKAARELKHPDGKPLFEEFRWAFGIEDVLDGIAYFGPAIFGLDWTEGMVRPEADGRIRPTGNLLGGHCIEGNQIDLKRERVWIPNTWSTGWGIKGRAYLAFEDLDTLLQRRGEAAFLVRKRATSRAPA